MPVFSSPVWNAPQAGIVGDAAATAGSAQINQFLGTHPSGLIYQGAQILTPAGTGVSPWAEQFSTLDIDQPFTMSGTAVGRVAIPLLAVGDGADLLVSLCADNSGTPGAMICQTRLPASWITQFAATSGAAGPSSVLPATQATGNALAAPQFNTLAVGQYATSPYSPPATGSANIVNPAVVSSGNYLITAGGTNQATGATVASVFTALADGTTLAPLVPQAVLPQTSWTANLIATTDTLVLAGGFITASDTSPSTDVLAASWNSATGVIGSWSAQASLPVGLQYSGCAASGENLYIVGGQSAAGYVNTVYWAAVANSQITVWNTGPALPQQLSNTSVIALGGFLIVVGGENSSVQSLATYYAAIDADGSLGHWVTGPPVPAAVINGGNQVVATPQGVIVTGNDTYTLGVSEDGLAPFWSLANDIGFTSQPEWILVPGAGADYELFTVLPLDPLSGRYRTATVTQTPMISVPVPATGLTSGATYHLLMQQQGGDLNNYLRTHTDVNVLPGNPTLLTSARGAYSWTAATAGHAVPIQIFDQTGPAAPGIMPWHTWDDNGAAITTLVNATTPDQRLLGLCEATRMGLALNANQGFESGLAQWTAFGGTPAQSTAQAHTGLYAAQVTPSGVAAQAFWDSEMLPCLPGQSVTVSGWFWFTSAVTTNASLSINWYTAGGTLISTSSNSVSVPAATWTELTNTFTAPSSGTLPYQFTINPTLGGTPAASNIFYIDDVYATYTHIGPQQSSVTLFNYPAAWPGQTWPLQSTVMLA